MLSQSRPGDLALDNWLNSKKLYGSTTLSGTARKMLSIWVWDSEKNSRWANTLATVILLGQC
tara:strand:+ start:992 stop:1177 length:186 start_codon:yes stop_codon:yes gene_type:complete